MTRAEFILTELIFTDKKKFIELLFNVLAAQGIDLTEVQAEMFFIYYEMLCEKNKVMNLTAITDAEDVIRKHFADSLLPIKTGLIKNSDKCADVGTGAGFPGLPLAIMLPDTTFTLIDSLGKRVSFLNDVISSLGLTNCTAVVSRAEEAAREEMRESFDIVLSRAVSALPILAELCLPLVRKDGYMIALKSVSAKQELSSAQNALNILGADTGKIFGTDERNAVIIQKKSATPEKYPRRNGVPEKKPL